MRTLMVVGRLKGDVIQLARYCAWGDHWMSREDEALHTLGAPTTHGCCDACLPLMEREFDRLPPSAA